MGRGRWGHRTNRPEGGSGGGGGGMGVLAQSQRRASATGSSHTGVSCQLEAPSPHFLPNLPPSPPHPLPRPSSHDDWISLVLIFFCIVLLTNTCYCLPVPLACGSRVATAALPSPPPPPRECPTPPLSPNISAMFLLQLLQPARLIIPLPPALHSPCHPHTLLTRSRACE